MSDEEIKNEFISCIDGSHTLNLAISILEDRERLQQRIDKVISFVEEIKSDTKGILNDYVYHKEHNKERIELLKEDLTICDKIIMDLRGDSDESN